MTKLLAIMFMLFPCAAFAGEDIITADGYGVVYPIYNPEPIEHVFFGDRGDTLIIKGETEVIAIYTIGHIRIQHGSCEKLGLKHA